MIIELSALSLASFSLVFLVSRRRANAKTFGENNKERDSKKKSFLTKSRKNSTLEQLNQKLIELERQRELLTKDFNHLDSAKQKRVLARVLKLNERIENIKEAINKN